MCNHIVELRVVLDVDAKEIGTLDTPEQYAARIAQGVFDTEGITAKVSDADVLLTVGS